MLRLFLESLWSGLGLVWLGKGVWKGTMLYTLCVEVESIEGGFEN